MQRNKPRRKLDRSYICKAKCCLYLIHSFSIKSKSDHLFCPIFFFNTAVPTGLEYADSISLQRSKTTQPLKCVIRVKLECIRWGSSSSGAPESVQYSFIFITPRSTLIRSGLSVTVLSMSQIGMFKRLFAFNKSTL